MLWVPLLELYRIQTPKFFNRFLQFLQLLHVIPKSGFSGNNIRGKNPHAEDWWFCVFFCWHTATDDLEFFQFSKTLHFALLRCSQY